MLDRQLQLRLCGLQDPRSGGEAQAHGVGDLAQALALLAQAPHLVPIEHQPRPSAPRPCLRWNVDAAIADDMLTVLRFLRNSHCYPGDLGFEKEIEAVWKAWRSGREASPEPEG